MAILETAGRIAATFADMAITRLSLAAVEIQEETQRLLGYVVLALLSLILSGIALLLTALLVVVVFWDTYRIHAAAGMALLFFVAAAVAALKLKAAFAARPAFLGATVGELNKDLNVIRHAGHDHE